LAEKKKKVEGYSSSFFTLPPNNSVPESAVIESKQHVETEKTSSESPRMSGGHGIGSSQGPKQDTEGDNLSTGCGCGDAVDGKSESKLNVVDKHDCASTLR